jgi:lysozyme family protein
MGHLHNGDPLLIQTVHVPAKRPPKPWLPDGIRDPKELWKISAKDALALLKRKVPDWSIAGMCHYTGGGFPRDHVFDPQYRSHSWTTPPTGGNHPCILRNRPALIEGPLLSMPRSRPARC